jgi:hypothetical protein
MAEATPVLAKRLTVQKSIRPHQAQGRTPVRPAAANLPGASVPWTSPEPILSDRRTGQTPPGLKKSGRDAQPTRSRLKAAFRTGWSPRSKRAKRTQLAPGPARYSAMSKKRVAQELTDYASEQTKPIGPGRIAIVRNEANGQEAARYSPSGPFGRGAGQTLCETKPILGACEWVLIA